MFNAIFLPNLAILLFMFDCAILGFAVNGRLDLRKAGGKLEKNIYLQWFFAINTGTMVHITLLFFLGLAAGLNIRMVFLSEAVLLAGAIFVIFHTSDVRHRLQNIHLKPNDYFEIFALFCLFIIIILNDVKMPGSWDDTSYHLPLARFYIQHQAILLDKYLRLPLIPQNIDLLFALGLMTGGDIAAQGMATLSLFVISLGLMGVAIGCLNSKIAGILSVLIFLSLHPVTDFLGYAYVDNTLACLCWGALLAIAIWVSGDGKSSGWIVIAGLLAGGATGSKYFGAVLAVLLGLYLVFVQKHWRATWIYTVTVFAFGSWWYVRSAVISGDPVHPAGENIFGYFLWNAQDLILVKKQLADHGTSVSIFHLWPALSKAGVTLLASAFFSLFFWGQEKKTPPLFTGIFLSYFIFWFCTAQVPRYLSPVLAVGSFLSAAVFYQLACLKVFATRMPKMHQLYGFIPKMLCLALLIYACVVSYTIAADNILQREKTLQGRPGYTLLSKANDLIPLYGPRIISVGFENAAYFFNGTFIGDWFGVGRYSAMITCQDFCNLIAPEKMIALMRSFDSRMLVVNTHRFGIDSVAYKKYFVVQKASEDGFLLTLK